MLGYCSLQRGWKLRVAGFTVLLGHWWLQDALRGGPDCLPVVNMRDSSQLSEEGQQWRLRCRCNMM